MLTCELHAAVSDEAAQLAKRLVERPEFQDKYELKLDDTNTDGVPIPRNIGTYGMMMQLIVVIHQRTHGAYIM